MRYSIGVLSLTRANLAHSVATVATAPPDRRHNRQSTKGPIVGHYSRSLLNCRNCRKGRAVENGRAPRWPPSAQDPEARKALACQALAPYRDLTA
jgi:hypothetical protein